MLLEKSLVSINNILRLTEQYSQKKSNLPYDISLLVEKNIIWTGAMVWDLEISESVTEVWLFTPDLKPDISDKSVGKDVNLNIKNGKKYVYFFPENIPHIELEIERLFNNLELNILENITYREHVTLISLSQEKFQYFYGKNNTILFFTDKNRSLPPRCFEELMLTQIKDRAVFWQENTEEKAKEIRNLYTKHLKEFALVLN